ncbi:MAG TPA: sensor domain-containing protein [Streptosporangiaceae bacterium]|nr:sensor domain-containing protein [Streptosporangiaceae bacterium]
MPAAKPGSRGFLGASAWRGTLYALLCMPLGLAGFIVTMLSLAVSAAGSLTVVGTLCFIQTFAVARLWTRLDRGLARWLLRLPADEPPRRQPSRPGLTARFAAGMRDRQSWRDIGFILLYLPAGILLALIVGLMAVLILRGVTYPFKAWDNVAYYREAWGGPSYLGAVAVHSVPGLLAIILGPAVIRAATGLQGRLIQRLIGSAVPRSRSAAGTASAEGRDRSGSPRHR